MKVLKSIIVPCALALTVSSCLNSGSNESSTTYQIVSGQTFTYVIDSQTGNSEVLDGADYFIKYNWSDVNADILIRDLPLPDGTEIDLEFTGLKYTIDKQGATVISAANAVDTSGDHSVTTLVVRRLDRHIGVGLYAPVTEISFILDGRYSVRGVQNDITLIGSTTATDIASGESESEFAPIYTFSFSDKGKATLIVQNIEILDQNYSKVQFSKLDYTVTNRGISIISSPDTQVTLIPNPVEGLTFDNFNAQMQFDFSTGLNFTVSDEVRIAADLGVLYNMNN